MAGELTFKALEVQILTPAVRMSEVYLGKTLNPNGSQKVFAPIGIWMCMGE